LDDSEARAAQGRINAENDFIRNAQSGTRDSRQGNGARRFAADAFLHLLELPQGNAHADTLPAAAKLQKEKHRAGIIRRGARA
jgi:hypothetical protein